MNSPKASGRTEEESLSLYAVFNLREPPRKLSRSISSSGECKKHFHLHFELPLPSQIIVFCLGKWETHFKGQQIVAEVSVDVEVPTKRIGTLTSTNKALCWDEAWPKKFLKKSEEALEQGRMAKLILRTEKILVCDDKENEKSKDGIMQSPIRQQQEEGANSPVTPSSFQNLKQQKLSFAEYTKIQKNDSEVKANKTLVVSKKRRRSNVETLSQGNKKHASASFEDCHRNISSSPETAVLTPPGTPLTTKSVPSCRWGHDMCLIEKRRAVMIGGQGGKMQMSKDSIWTLDMGQGCATWHQETCDESGGADRRIGHTVTFDHNKRVLYVYGGSKNKRWFNDVNIYDLQTNTWSAVKAVGNAPTRAYHSCNFFNGELLVFGGVYPNPDPEPDSCSNDLYIFNADARNWYKPLTTGTPPSPKSGHSASLIEDRLILFGGWDFPKCFNDVSIIDLAMMEFSSPVITGCLPSPRSWHASAVLPRQRVFIHGGYDGNQILTDSFIFNIDSLTCITVKTSDRLTARAGHVALYLAVENDREDKEEIVVFGGGDNAGGYFNDLVFFSPSVC